MPVPESVAASRRPLTESALAGLAGPGRTVPRLEVLAAAASTNTLLSGRTAEDPGAWPHMSALVADHQTAGRGRSGRGWVTPAGSSLTLSFVVRPEVSLAETSWLPLVVGQAVATTLRDAGVGGVLKWPNDVVVDAGAAEIPGWGRWRKVVGILCEAVPGQSGTFIAGIGINVSQEQTDLPVPHAASLLTLGAARLDRAALLRSLIAHLADAVAHWEADASSAHREIAGLTATLGQVVTVAVPSGETVEGEAVRLDDSGALVVRLADGTERGVNAGDVSVRRA